MKRQIILNLQMSDNNWFTVERIDDDTYAISEYGHWENTHCYLFIGDKKAVLIDSGLGVGNIKKIAEQITQLPITIVITHAHWDHIGGCKWFNDIAVHENDKDWIEKGLPVPVEMVKANFLKNLFTKTLPDNFNPNTYCPFKGRVTIVLQENEEFDLGNRKIKIIHTPGHSPGHIAIYEQNTGYLVTGDMLYEGVLDVFYASTNPVQFADSINKLYSLPYLTKLLPGHFRLNIPVSYLQECKNAFDKIKQKNQLRQGTGVHKFKHLSIHL